jgi:hypothetical protein
MPRPFCTLVLLVVALGVVAGSAEAGSDFNTISHHTDAGRGGIVGVATDVPIDKPTKVLLKIRVRPNVPVIGEYIMSCRSGEGDRENASDKFKTRSRQIELPIFYAKPKDCLLYAEAARKRSSRINVKLSMRVIAKQRPGAFEAEREATKEFAPKDLKGKRVARARQTADKNGYQLRVVKRNGEWLTVTQYERGDRINVAVRDRRIVRFLGVY